MRTICFNYYMSQPYAHIRNFHENKNFLQQNLTPVSKQFTVQTSHNWLDPHHISVYLMTYCPTDLITAVISWDPFLRKSRGPKINFGIPTVFEIYKFQKPLWEYLGIPDYAHLKLFDQFVAIYEITCTKSTL